VKKVLRKKVLIFILISIVVVTTGVLVPVFLLSGSNGSATVTRMYADSLEGPWTTTSSSTTRWIEEITVVNGQQTIVIQEVDFIWEAPEGTFVFVGKKGDKGDQGPQGPKGEDCTIPTLPNDNGQTIETTSPTLQ
jgi:hypothetical protein